MDKERGVNNAMREGVERTPWRGGVKNAVKRGKGDYKKKGYKRSCAMGGTGISWRGVLQRDRETRWTLDKERKEKGGKGKFIGCGRVQEEMGG